MVAKIVRHGECSRCGDCCCTEVFKIPRLWKDGECVYLEGNKCTVWDTPECPEECKKFPSGMEDHILKKLGTGERLDFTPLLPSCSFWFEVVRE